MDTRGLSRRRTAGWRRVVAIGSALVVATTLAGACGNGNEPEDGAAPPATTAEDGSAAVVITIADFTYQVPDTVEPGATITVRNADGVGHTVTSDEEGIFDVAVGPGQEVTFTVPQEAGEYPFHCIPHPQMTGTLVVG